MGYFSLIWRVQVSCGKLPQMAYGAVGAIAANAILDYLLVKPFGINGIALATPLVTLGYVLFFAFPVRRTIKSFHGPGGGIFVLKVLVASTTMGAIVYLFTVCFESRFDTAAESLRLIEVVFGLALGGSTYTGLLYLFRVQQVRQLFEQVLGMLRYPSGRSV